MISVICRQLPRLQITKTVIQPASSSSQFFHTTSSRRDLSEFFDDPKNFGKNAIRVGREWKKDELRLKSNVDLHKLWYVLLKERNMLLTMEEAYKEAKEEMPNEERIDKVQISMDNLETVVRERNRAYFELETGESGERERLIIPGPFGFDVGYKQEEHNLPWKFNQAYRSMLRYRYHTNWGTDVRNFHARYLEMKRSQRAKKTLVQMRHVARILQRFPDTDEEAIKEKYPLVDVDVVKRWRIVRGHHDNSQYNV